jgi:hypothetical protein
VRQYIGVPMPPAPLLLADRRFHTQSKIYVLCGFTYLTGGQNKKKAKKRGGPNSSERLAYFQDNRLLTELYKQETEIC